MKKAIGSVFALSLLVLGLSAYSNPMMNVQRSEPLDIGSCYSVQPICLGSQRPICICDYARNCFWACK
jgi:hypothetical protein